MDGIAAALRVKPIGEAVNLARGHTVPLKGVIDSIERVTGADLGAAFGEPEAGDVRVTHACIDKAREVLGYAPSVDLDEGIARQWEHVQAASVQA